MNPRPSFAKNEHILTLDYFKASGLMNGFGAKQYLMTQYPQLSDNVAAAIVCYWLTTQGKA